VLSEHVRYEPSDLLAMHFSLEVDPLDAQENLAKRFRLDDVELPLCD